MAIKWTAAQNQVIDPNNKDKNLLVSASSGSGKTTIMIERIVRMIVDDNESIDNILVTTFTNAAALDMKAKLIASLSDALIKASDKRHISTQLEMIETAQICTLHSFCSDLIRKYYYIAGVDYAFSVIQDMDSALKKSKALKVVIEEYLENGDEVFLKLYDIFSRKRREDTLASVVNQIYTFYRTLPVNADWLNSEQNYAAADKYLDKYKLMADEYFVTKAKTLLDKANNVGYGRAAEIAQIIIDGAKSGAFPKRYPTLNKIEDLDPDSLYIHNGIKELSNSARNFYNDFFDNLKDTAKISDELALKLKETVKKYSDVYDGFKREDFELDFADLEHYAYIILSSDEVKQEIKQKYKYIFVDEYQDINPMQEELICKIADNNLFMVGDVKQSIYRFRLCDPDIFVNKYKDYKTAIEGGNIAIDLNDNFRSVKSILDFDNEIFSRIMTEQMGAINYARDAKFTPKNNDIESKYLAVMVSVAQMPKDEKIIPDSVYSVKNHNVIKRYTKEYAEADLIIREISNLLENGRIEEKQNGNVKLRCPIFGDIVILMRSVRGASYEIVQRISKVYPVVCNMDTEILKRFEALMITDYLRLIDNPFNDIPLAGALKGVFGGMDENQISAIRAKYPKEQFFYEAAALYKNQQNDDIAVKLKDFFENLKQMRAYAECHTVSNFIWHLIAKYDYEEYLLTHFEDADFEYTEIFIQMAEKYNTASSFINYIDNGIISPIADAPTYKGANAIRIMTVHQSKGLEFPVVIAARMGREFKNTGAEVLVDRNVGIGLKNYDFEQREYSSSRIWSAIKYNNDKNEMEEEMRILYVALTRAKYHLIVTGTIKADFKLQGLAPYEILKAKSPLSWILAVLARDKNNLLFEANKCEGLNLLPCYKLKITQAENLVLTDEDNENIPKISTIDKNLQSIIKNNLDFKYNNKDISVKYTVTELNKDDDFVWQSYITEEERGTVNNNGLIKGNAYHCAMKYIDINVKSKDEIQAELKRLADCGLMKSEYLPYIDIDKIFCALNSPLFCRIRSQKLKFYREKEFMLYLTANELGIDGTDKVLVQGVIDMLVYTKDGVIILDYKTTQGSEADLAQMYNKQLKLYATAAKKILNENIDSMLIYSFEKDKEILITV